MGDSESLFIWHPLQGPTDDWLWNALARATRIIRREPRVLHDVKLGHPTGLNIDKINEAAKDVGLSEDPICSRDESRDGEIVEKRFLVIRGIEGRPPVKVCHWARYGDRAGAREHGEAAEQIEDWQIRRWMQLASGTDIVSLGVLRWSAVAGGAMTPGERDRVAEAGVRLRLACAQEELSEMGANMAGVCEAAATHLIARCGVSLRQVAGMTITSVIDNLCGARAPTEAEGADDRTSVSLSDDGDSALLINDRSLMYSDGVQKRPINAGSKFADYLFDLADEVHLPWDSTVSKLKGALDSVDVKITKGKAKALGLNVKLVPSSTVRTSWNERRARRETQD